MNSTKDERPWGKYEVISTAKGTQAKRIEVYPGKRFSLQKHLKRAEKWIIMVGRGMATVGSRQFEVGPGAFIEVPCGEIHRMHNVGADPLVFIEVQFGDYLGEDDIIRLEDDFRRK